MTGRLITGRLITSIVLAFVLCAGTAPSVHAQVQAKSAFGESAVSSKYSDAQLSKFIQWTAHLASVEAPLTVAKMLCDGYETLVSGKPTTEVIASTKKAHAKGEIFDGIGGYSARGVTDRVEDAKRDNLVPIGLLQGATAKRDIPIDTLVTYDDVDLDENQTIFQLRQKQDQLGL